MSAAQRVAVEVTLRCDGACRFCAQRGLLPTDADAHDVTAQIEQAASAGHEITFVGGEPSNVPELVELIALARRVGAPAVGLQTHGRSLADAERLTALVDAGLTDVHLSIHGARAAVHDYHTDSPGSFDATLAGLSAVRSSGLTVVVSTVVTRSNFRVLAELPERLVGWGVAAWSLRWITAAGGAQSAFDRLVPRFGLAAPFVLHAASTAMRRGLPTFVAGLPTCTMGPVSGLRIASPVRTFAAACEACPARPDCCGADRRYHERFGGDELRPAAAPAAPVRAHPLRRLFVGVGRLAPIDAVEVADSPRRARSRLPILGRPDPARAEVRRKSTADPEALRGLFPALFDDDTT